VGRSYAAIFDGHNGAGAAETAGMQVVIIGALQTSSAASNRSPPVITRRACLTACVLSPWESCVIPAVAALQAALAAICSTSRGAVDAALLHHTLLMLLFCLALQLFAVLYSALQLCPGLAALVRVSSCPASPAELLLPVCSAQATSAACNFPASKRQCCFIYITFRCCVSGRVLSPCCLQCICCPPQPRHLQPACFTADSLLSCCYCLAARKLHLLLASHPALRLYRGETGPPAVVKQEEAAVGSALKQVFRQVCEATLECAEHGHVKKGCAGWLCRHMSDHDVWGLCCSNYASLNPTT
jgi:hypothetical protein